MELEAMEEPSLLGQWATTLGGLLLAIVVCLLLQCFVVLQKKKKKRLPPGPVPWPIVGNLPRLLGKASHLVLQEMANRYGPVMTIWMGSLPTLIISSDEAAYEALVVEGAHFASRPQQPMAALFSNHYRTTSTSLYGPFWMKLRHILANHLQNPNPYRHIRKEEVEALLDRLRYASSTNGEGVVAPLVDIRLAVCAIMARICFGEDFSSLSGQTKLKQLDLILNSIHRIFLAANLQNYIPLMRFLPSSRDAYSKCLQLCQDVNDFCLPIILAQQCKLKTPSKCLMDSLLILDNENDDGNKLSPEDILWNLIEVVIGGVDNTSITLEWALAYLVLHPDIQHRAYTEVKLISKDTPHLFLQDEEKVHEMPYLQAVVKETLRRSGPAVLSVPHATCEKDCKLLGFDVPAKTQVIINQYAILNDPKVWSDPLTFRPERHLPLPNELGRGKSEEGKSSAKYTAFGLGRRICPGMNMGKLHIHLILANLLLNFEWLPAEPNQVVDLTGKLKFVYSMKTPLRARIVQRLV